MFLLDRLIKVQLEKLRSSGLYRDKIVTANMLNFSRNDYLALTDNKKLHKAYQRGYALYPCGSSGSPVICGYHAAHQELEQFFAQQLNADAGMLFTSGYAANLAIVALLQSLSAYLLIDKYIHASIYDGIKLVNAQYKRYLHNNIQNLANISHSLAPQQNLVVLTEGIFSMSGSIAALDQIAILCQELQMPCIVDESHSFGIIGKHGLGTVELFRLTQDLIPLRIISFGKALGAQGAIVIGNKNWLNALLQHARGYIYSTAMSPAVAYGILTAVQLAYDADDQRVYLQDLITYFRECCSQYSYVWRDSISPIQQLQLGCPYKARQLSQYLLSHNIICYAIRQPTVTLKNTGLRIVLNCRHTQSDIDLLFNKLQQFYA